jgi:CYTH domain-containing protein
MLMPTENERKYILNLKCEPAIASMAHAAYEIKQGYLENIRVRSKLYLWENKNIYEFCFKKSVFQRVLEINISLDDRDFGDLWQLATIKLDKIRYEIDWLGKLWEVDFFLDTNRKVYFSMAEHEMPELQLTPDIIPDIINKNMLFEVPFSDGRFASKRIADMNYARELLKEIAPKELE